MFVFYDVPDLAGSIDRSCFCRKEDPAAASCSVIFFPFSEHWRLYG